MYIKLKLPYFTTVHIYLFPVFILFVPRAGKASKIMIKETSKENGTNFSKRTKEIRFSYLLLLDSYLESIV